MTLLKQAREFGVGILLATQNPVDLDYKALSNAGTWFVGKLQTERDKARLLDGSRQPRPRWANRPTGANWNASLPDWGAASSYCTTSIAGCRWFQEAPALSFCGPLTASKSAR